MDIVGPLPRSNSGKRYILVVCDYATRYPEAVALRTSPYHRQTDGLVERFNQTLKVMLRKAAVEKGKDWDKMIPYLLIAYREVPQASTGFSPFELLYGRAVHGPLDVLRQTWEVDRKTDESVVSHILSIAIRDKMEKMQDCSVYCFG